MFVDENINIAEVFRVLLFVTWIFSVTWPCVFFLLDLPLLENSATGLLAVLPKTTGALEDIEWICPFLPT